MPNSLVDCVYSSTIIDHIIAHCEPRSSAAIAYFYFDFRDDHKLHLRGLLSSLIEQILSRSATIPAPLSDLFSRCSNGRRIAPIEDLKFVLFECARIFDDVYIVIDALDEPPPDVRRTDLLPFLESLLHAKLPGLHLMVTSRKELDIREFFERTDHVPIDISTGHINDDITMHIRSVLSQDSRLKQRPTEIHALIELELTERANGMYGSFAELILKMY